VGDATHHAFAQLEITDRTTAHWSSVRGVTNVSRTTTTSQLLLLLLLCVEYEHEQAHDTQQRPAS